MCWCLVNRILPHHVGYNWPDTAPVINQLPPCYGILPHCGIQKNSWVIEDTGWYNFMWMLSKSEYIRINAVFRHEFTSEYLQMYKLHLQNCGHFALWQFWSKKQRSQVTDRNVKGYTSKLCSTFCTYTTVYKPVLTGMRIGVRVPVNWPEVK